jgi:chromosome segregation ATPase
MEREIICPSCGLQGRIPEGFSEPRVQCPRCSTSIEIAGNQVNPPAAVRANGPGRLERIESLDELFARLYTQTGPSPDFVPGAIPAPDSAPVLPPALAAVPTDTNAEKQWLGAERQRLQTYMAQQFTAIQRQRDEFSRWRFQVEATLIAREQEANRQATLLAAQAETLKQREQCGNEREVGWAAQQEQREAVAQELRALEEAREQLQQDAQAQRAALEQLRDEAAAKATWMAQRQQLEHRVGALDRAEEALNRRLHELDAMELQLRQELGEWEQRLRAEHRDLEVQRRRLRNETEDEGAPFPRPETPLAEVERLQQELTEQRQVNAELRDQLCAITRELDRGRAQPDACERTGSDRQAVQAPLASPAPELTELHAALGARTRDLERVRQKAEGEKASLRAQLTTQAQELRRLRSQIASQDKQIADLRSHAPVHLAPRGGDSGPPAPVDDPLSLAAAAPTAPGGLSE